jgi:cyclic pyranopterin monophosphate synthase
MEKNLSHTDAEGRARMVDVGQKPPQRRRAAATGRISLSAEALALVRQNQIKKGDVLGVAQIAGIQAAKRTAGLIPLCHTLILDKIGVELRIDDDGVVVESEVMCVGRTGAEMEALTAVTVALLTVYDMCKAVDKRMKIGGITLVSKEKEDVI